MKANQAGLMEAIETLFAEGSPGFRQARQRGRHGDRLERRRLRSSSELNDYLDWPGVAQVFEVRRWVRRGQEAPTIQICYGITSLSEGEASPSRLAKLVRDHWRIENRLHWVRDVTLLEDQCTIRTEAAPYAMVSLRNTVLSLLRGNRVGRIAEAFRRNAAKPRLAIRYITAKP